MKGSFDQNDWIAKIDETIPYFANFKDYRTVKFLLSLKEFYIKYGYFSDRQIDLLEMLYDGATNNTEGQ
jgi:hypothetical protein